MEVTGVHDTDKDADSEALDKLSQALGDGSQEAAEKAKGLFPFIAFEADMADDDIPDDDAADDDPLAALDSRRPDSTGRRPPPTDC